MEINVLIKISKDSRNMYGIDKESRLPKLTSTLSKASPGDYGTIIKAQSVGGLGCLILSEEPSLPCSIVPAKAIGSFTVEFQDVTDNEIIAVPINSDISDIRQIPKQKIKEIAEFIEYVKLKEVGKKVKIKSVENADKADKIIQKAIELWERTKL